ncbi:MAG: DUF4055 domain-containing protein [Nitrososphaerales archaeon]
MSVDSKHPEYIDFLPDWQEMRHTFRGERAIKEARLIYLPATRGMVLDGMATGAPGWTSYEAYKTRAVYHNFVGEGVETLLGMMWMKPPTIELPEQMEEMRSKATVKGESLEMLLRRINEEQLITGRVGVMLDLPTGETFDTEILPYIVMYNAESIINWDDGASDELVFQNLNVVALDESEQERDETFQWQLEDKTRLLLLGEQSPNEGEGGGVYTQGLFKGSKATFDENLMITPTLRGRTLDKIPFVFINSKDITPDPDDPPLLDLANLCLAIYRTEADYRQSLFLQGQDTLVVSGSSGDDGDNFRTGAGAAIAVSADGGAEFIGVNSQGLGEQRQALDNDKALAAKKAGSLAQKGAQVESGDAMKIRFSATTASLTQIALTGAFGLENLLKIQAEWMGLNPDDVSVIPNLDFADVSMDPAGFKVLQEAVLLGLELSGESMHTLLVDAGMTNFTREEEQQKISDEPPRATSGIDVGIDEDSDA